MDDNAIFLLEQTTGIHFKDMPGRLESPDGRAVIEYDTDKIKSMTVDGKNVFFPGDPDKSFGIARLAYKRPLDTIDELEMAYRQSLQEIKMIGKPDQSNLFEAMRRIYDANICYSNPMLWRHEADAVMDLDLDFSESTAEYMRAGRDKYEIREAIRKGEPEAALWFARTWAKGPVELTMALDHWMRQGWDMERHVPDVTKGCPMIEWLNKNREREISKEFDAENLYPKAVRPDSAVVFAGAAGLKSFEEMVNEVKSDNIRERLKMIPQEKPVRIPDDFIR